MQPLIAVGVGLVVLAVVTQYSLHKVEEGHEGVYFRGGAMLQVRYDLTF